MFRAQQNEFDDVIGKGRFLLVLAVRFGGVPCEIRVLIRFYFYGNIAKATDETLTSENWEYMMDAWEKINESGENGYASLFFILDIFFGRGISLAD